MCLAVPGKIIEINEDIAKIDYGKDIIREGNCSLVECIIGDYVIIQAGFILEIVDKNRAEEMFKIMKG